MKFNDKGFNLITEFEGCSLHAYQDIGGIWTIGFGHIVGVKREDFITYAQAKTILAGDINNVADSIKLFLPNTLNDNQFSSLVSFAFNLGVYALKGSTLLKHIKSGNMDLAADEFLKWDLVKGKQVAGLTRRREAERALFLDTEVA